MIERCLASVLASLPSDGELVVSDDGSTDDTRARIDKVAASDPRIRLLAGLQTGPAGARNRGWRASRAEVVVFIDDDCLAEPGWVPALLAGFTSGTVAAVEGRTIPEGKGDGFFSHSIDASAGSYLTCNLAVRRAALEAVGGFDENYPFPAMEDLDLCHTIVERCGEIAFAPSAIVRHRVVPIGPAYYFRQTRRNNPSAFRLFAKHPRVFASARTKVWPFLKDDGASTAPSVLEISAFIISYNLIHAARILRDASTLRERVLGAGTYVTCAALTVAGLPRGARAYRAGLSAARST